MAFSFRIDTKHSIVLFKATEILSTNDVLTCVEKVVADPEFRSEFDHLVDLRQVTDFEASSEDVKTRATRNHDDKRLNASRIAIVTSSDLVFGMSRMYAILMEDAPITVRVFRNMEDAMTWLGNPTDSE